MGRGLRFVKRDDTPSPPYRRESKSSSLVPRPSLSLSSAITILEAGKKELVKREEGLVKLVTWG